LRSRGDQVSSTQPEPPRCAFPIAENSAAQSETLPKSRISASRSAPSGSPPSPSEAKKISWRIIEFIAISSSRLRPLITKIGALVKSSSASSFVMALSR
jgi:hypothetical protein